MKKILALVLALVMVLAATSAFAADLLPAGDTYPLNSDKTVTWYSQDCLNPHEKYATWQESPFHTNLAKLLGVNIEWSFPTTGADGGSFTNTMLADPGSLPNIMKGYFMDSANMLLEDEVIWDLTPYIQEYAPAYYAWLQTNPAYDRAMKTDDGRYYAFGFFREDGGWNDSYLGVVVRQDWLQECGLELPTTISELENVIRVFHDKYGAQFAFANDGRFRQAGIQGAFGAYATGYVASDYGWFVKDGKVNFGAIQPEWREYMKWMAKMWKEGLIDQDSFSLDDTSIKSKTETGKVGVSYTSMGQLNLWNKDMGGDYWVGAHFPTADDGSISSQFGGFGIGTHTTVITKTADEETMKLCLRMLDYAYTQEGFLFWNYGIEGESWEMNPETGLPKWTPLVADDHDNDPMTKYNGATWGNSCIQATNLLYLKNSPVAIAANDAFFYTFGKDEYFADPEVEAKTLAVTGGWKWPVGITFTTDESDQLDLLGGNSNLNTYVAENYAAFINGSKDINDDAVWEAYLAGFGSLNLEKILAIRQGALDRYQAR